MQQQIELIHRRFEAQVARDSEATAVWCGGRYLTYAQLNSNANVIARTLLQRGIKPDDRVALYTERSLEMIIGLLGILKAGGAYVPVDPSYPSERVAFMLEDSAPVVVLTDRSLAERTATLERPFIVIGDDPGQCSDNPVVPDLGPGNLAYVIYTSGSTGTPKGVMVEHGNVSRLFTSTEPWFQFDSRDVWTLFHSIAFDFSVWELWGALAYGGRVVVVPYLTARSPSAFLRLLREQQVTVLNQTPSAFGQLVASIGAISESADENSLAIRVVIFGGEALEPASLRPWTKRFGVHRPRLINMYGITETTVHVTYRELTEEDIETGRGSVIGRPIPDLSVYILDNQGQPVPIGLSGELYVGGAGVARGYLNRPELTAERFIPKPFGQDAQGRLYRTGDLGRRRADGDIEYLGRNDQQVKIRGYRIELGEIQSAMLEFPCIKEAAVLAREDVSGERRLVGYVVTDVRRLKTFDDQGKGKLGAEIVDQWKTVFEETYSEAVTKPTFIGWNSSYTGKPIPAEQMREWLDTTVNRIRALKPRRALEIGCGVGLLVEHLAPLCQAYRGSDLSAVAIERLRTWVAGQPQLKHVELECCSALELNGVQPGGYDTVIVNSVVQLLPDIDYLAELIRRAVKWVAPGGRIFIGDVRPLGLLSVFQNSVQLQKAGDATTVGQLRQMVANAIDREKDLLIDPRFFIELAQKIPGMGEAQVLLRRGVAENELTRYRYDVVMEVGDSLKAPAADPLLWNDKQDMVSVLTQCLQRRASSVSVRGVPNRRLSSDLEAARLIAGADELCTVKELREKLSHLEPIGEDPELFWRLAEEYGYSVRVGWEVGREDGQLNVEWRDESGGLDLTEYEASHLPQRTVATSGRICPYANDPWGKTLQRRLITRLREFLSDRLPPYMVPSGFVALDALPLTTNGKLDRAALPSPGLEAYSSAEYEAPRGRLEELLARMWQDLLRVDRVGRHDNFFALGGHSLLIVQMIGRLREVNLSAAVHDVFESPTLAALAATLEGAQEPVAEVPPNGISPDSVAIVPEMLPLVDLSQAQIDSIVEATPGGAQNIQDIYPLSPLQEGMLFHHALNEKGDTYVSVTLFKMRSRSKLEEFKSALQRVIERHDALRTAVLWAQLPRPIQVVWRNAMLPTEDLLLDPERDTIEQLRERMRPEYQRLKLSTAPLMRLQVASDPNGLQWYALLQLHHLASDRISLEIITSEVRNNLAAQGAELSEPEPYRNHVAQAVSTERYQAENFFRRLLGDIDEPTAPFGLLNIHGDGSENLEESRELPEELASRLRAQARRAKVSTAAIFHAAWSLVVSRTSGRRDVIFGTVLSGRMQGRVGTQRAVGMFINTLPLRIDLQDLSSADLIRRSHNALTSLLKFEQTPLTVAQRCSALPTTVPLFSSLLNYVQSAGNPKTEWGREESGIQVLAREWRTNFPVSLTVEDYGDRFTLTAQVHRSIDATRIAEYVDTAIQSVVSALETDSRARVLELPVLPKGEQHQVIEGFNATRVPYPEHQLVHGLFEDQVKRTPKAIALHFEDQSLTYEQLNGRANQLAVHLLARGVGPDVAVGICVERSIEMVVGLLGILKAGGAYVPLDPNYPVDRLRYMLEDANPKVLLTQGHLVSGVPPTRAEVIALDRQWSEIAQHSTDTSAAELSGLAASHLAYIIYTSGSTGQPKGAMNEHRGVVNRLQWMQDTYGLTTQDVVLQKTPFSFDVSVWEFFWALMTGARLILARPEGHKDPAYLQNVIEQAGVTTVHFVPSMLQQFLDQVGPGKCRSLQHIICSGEEMSASLQRACFETLGRIRLSNLYGPTEAAVDVTAWECRPEDVSSRVPIGRPIANLRMYVLDQERQPVPIGAPGELYIAGIGVGRGYLNRPALTAERFLSDPFSEDTAARIYRTGDLGRWRPDGNIEYLGRNDHQVKIRGFRVELGEIEAALLSHAAVKAAAVVAREDEPGERYLVAYLTLREAGDLGDAPRVEELRAHLKGLLPEQMVPSALVVLDRLPLSPNGKLDRRALPAPLLSAYATRQYEPAEGEIENTLAEIWRALLHVDRVGRRDSFFALGGHSLLAMQLTVRVRAVLSSEIPVGLIFEYPTLRELAHQIGEMSQERLLVELGSGRADVDELYERVASMSDAMARKLIGERMMGGRP